MFPEILPSTTLAKNSSRGRSYWPPSQVVARMLRRPKELAEGLEPTTC